MPVSTNCSATLANFSFYLAGNGCDTIVREPSLKPTLMPITVLDGIRLTPVL